VTATSIPKSDVSPVNQEPSPSGEDSEGGSGTESQPAPERSAILWRGVRFSLAVYGISRVLAATAIVVSSRFASGTSLSKSLRVWDGGWYLRAIVEGYPQGPITGRGPEAQSTVAFFPLYRLIARTVSDLTGLGALEAGALVSIVAGAAATVLLWLLAEQLVGSRAADRTVLLFCFFPASFLLLMLFSEGLMVALSVGCLLALRRRRWIVAGVCAGLATATRPNAVVLAGCCLWAAGVAIWRDREWRSLAAPLLAPTGILAYFGFLWHHTGDWFAWFHVEYRGWPYGEEDRLTAVKSLKYLFREPLDFNQITCAVAFLIAIGGLWLIVRWRPPAELVILTIGTCLLAFGNGGPASKLRYVMTAFPLLIAAGRWARTELRFATLLAASTVGFTLYAALVAHTQLAVP
jgi:hypothetical protein